ncbi:conserved hypothetical protein [Carnobacterium maltaromaticum]|uniref:hypothetical protein n=1 Tax=Carnobacterium maltaromaticum TaxID=2751 RepID=UPI00191B93FC|nr:hypothetical protein [Carnobacterium maltaromaticum]CAD5899518.1 conserved hypothetical protein [Carnobacterium maltaromaticum]
MRVEDYWKDFVMYYVVFEKDKRTFYRNIAFPLSYEFEKVELYCKEFLEEGTVISIEEYGNCWIEKKVVSDLVI